MPNPGVTTLATMRATARQQADMVNSQFCTDAEINGYLNSSYYELYNLIVQTYGDDYKSVRDANGNGYQFTTTGTAEMYALPDGSSTYKMPDNTTAPAFFKGLGVDLWISSVQAQPQQWFTLHRFNMGERNRYTLPNAIGPWGYIGLKYRFEGDFLWLKPLPQAGQLIQLRYVPRLTPLAADGDTADLVSGWEEYIVVDTAIKMLAKEESDVSVLMARKAEIKAEVIASAANRDPSEPMTVVDAYASNGDFGGMGWGRGF